MNISEGRETRKMHMKSILKLKTLTECEIPLPPAKLLSLYKGWLPGWLRFSQHDLSRTVFQDHLRTFLSFLCKSQLHISKFHYSKELESSQMDLDFLYQHEGPSIVSEKCFIAFTIAKQINWVHFLTILLNV